MTPPGGPRPEHESERFMVLQMVQDGTISTDDGARLLEAMNRAERTQSLPEPPAPPKPAKSVHIVITNKNGDREVDLNLPVALVEVGFSIVSKFAGDKIAEMPNIREIASSGFTGKLLDINHGSDRIEISIE